MYINVNCKRTFNKISNIGQMFVESFEIQGASKNQIFMVSVQICYNEFLNKKRYV